MASGSLIDGSLRAQITQLSRDPFRDVLAQLLGVKLTPEALDAFANKSPDRWAQAVVQFAKPAGYTERLEVNHSGGIMALVAEVQAMSDAQLEARVEHGVTRSPATHPPKALASGSPGSTSPAPSSV